MKYVEFKWYVPYLDLFFEFNADSVRSEIFGIFNLMNIPFPDTGYLETKIFIPGYNDKPYLVIFYNVSDNKEFISIGSKCSNDDQLDCIDFGLRCRKDKSEMARGLLNCIFEKFVQDRPYFFNKSNKFKFKISDTLYKMIEKNSQALIKEIFYKN